MHSTDAEWVPTSLSMSTLTLCLVLAASMTAVLCTPDTIIYDHSTQPQCTEVTRKPTRNCKWTAGLDSFVDQVVEGGRIVAYKIQWFNGKWSKWFVPGVNDIDWKFNPRTRYCAGRPIKAKTMRRVWSYFSDHKHMFIICKSI